MALVASKHQDATLQRWKVNIDSANTDEFIADWCQTTHAVLVQAVEIVNDVVLTSEYHGRGMVKQPKAY